MKEKMRRKLNTARITRCGMAAVAAVSLILASVIPFPGELLAGEELEEVRSEESMEREEPFDLDEEESLDTEEDADGEEVSDEESAGKEEIADKDDVAVAQDEIEDADDDAENDGDAKTETDEADEPEERLAESDMIKATIEQNDNKDNEDEFPYVLMIENKTNEEIDGIRVASDADGLSFSYFCEIEDAADNKDADNAENNGDDEGNLKTVRQVFSKDDEDGELVFAEPLEAGEKIAVLLYAEYAEDAVEAYGEYAQEDTEELYSGYEDAIVTVAYESGEEPLKILIPMDCIEEIAERQEEERAEASTKEDDDGSPQADEGTDIKETSERAAEPEYGRDADGKLTDGKTAEPTDNQEDGSGEAEEPDNLVEEQPAPTEEPPVPAPEAQQPEDNGVFSITLPTTFEIPMFSTDEGIEVMSEDVVLCNEGDFPVDVTVSRVEVSVKRRLPESTVRQVMMPVDGNITHDLVEEAKQCDLSLRLLLDGQDAQERPAPEGVMENAAVFTLAAKQLGTDAEQLMEDRFADQVDSPDYAILNFRGTATDGTGFTWEKGDLKAKIVFSFAKHEEP